MGIDYRPRFSFDITDEQQTRCDKLISTHGMRKALFQPILDDVLDLLEEHGQIIAGIIMGKKAKPKEVMPILNNAERRAER
jgi:hypothetical protein